MAASMDAQQLLDEMVQAAARLGVEVRTEPFETPAAMGGGLCLVRGTHLVLIDQRAPLVDRLRALARALGDLGSEAVYMAPEARELVDGSRPRVGVVPWSSSGVPEGGGES
ncbi:MAG: hypothetical protein ACREKJ_01450 [Candidatus Rokuibacteriota bacterium]